MAQFMQVGNRAVNLDHVEMVVFTDTLDRTGDGGEPLVRLYGEAKLLLAEFAGDDYDGFRSWWDNHAPVYVVK